MGFKCEQCGKSYEWKHHLIRHQKHKHQGSGYDSHLTRNGNGSSNGPPVQPKSFTFKHPFTMMTTAPTSGGKTWLVKKLLENRSRWIEPTPQRIIWLYGQWQPLYEEMKRTIPGIEFVKGIPWNIGDETFLDPKVRNLIVIDDLMSEATNDTKICDLFTKGSHHRNLSVICLLQNLYYQGKENRTMSLNSHYLVLFKNPRDQQQVMTLARQMYPGNSQHFMDIYKAATDKPYGYVIIDLKPETSEAERFQPNILESIDSQADRGTHEWPMQPTQSREEMTSMTDGNQMSQILEELRQLRQSLNSNVMHKDDILEPPGKRFKRSPSSESHHSELDPATINMPSCPQCGAYYATWEDLHRHQTKNCPMTSNEKVKKKMCPTEERQLWVNVVKDNVNDELRDEYNDRIHEIMEKEGKSEKEAQRKTYNEYVPKLRKSYRRSLANYLIQMQQILETDMYQKLMQTAENLMEKEDYDLQEAIKQALKQRKFMFDQLVLEQNSEESDHDGEYESDPQEND